MSDSVPNAALEKPAVPKASFHELTQKFDEHVAKISQKTLDRFCFGVDGLDFDVCRIFHNGKYHFLINATIGYMPFSIESGDRRNAIKTIVLATRSLPKVRFDIDTSSRIVARALFNAPEKVSLELIFYPLILFMQEARPFVGLIGKYLFGPPLPPPMPKEEPKEEPKESSVAKEG